MGRMLWWLCVVGESGFDHLIVALCVERKCGFVLVVRMGGLRG